MPPSQRVILGSMVLGVMLRRPLGVLVPMPTLPPLLMRRPVLPPLPTRALVPRFRLLPRLTAVVPTSVLAPRFRVLPTFTAVVPTSWLVPRFRFWVAVWLPRLSPGTLM